jgi:hypothetical protein
MTKGDQAVESEVVHRLKNYLSVVLGFSDLLLQDVPDRDPRHADLMALRQAAQDAMSLTVQLGQDPNRRG